MQNAPVNLRLIVKKIKQQTVPHIQRSFTYITMGIILLNIAIGAVNTFRDIGYDYYQDTATALVLFASNSMLLIGGFLVGALLTRKGDRDTKLFAGVVFALFNISLTAIMGQVLFWLLGPTSETELMLNIMLPFAAIVITITLFLLLQRNSKNGEITRASMFVTSMLVVGNILAVIFLTLLSGSGEITLFFLAMSPYGSSIMAIIFAYLLLSQVTPRRTRIFYASFIGAITLIATQLVWSFMSPTSILGIGATYGSSFVLGTLVVVALIWKARRDVARKNSH